MEPTRPRSRPVGVLLPCLLLAFCIHGPPSLALDTVSRDQPLSGGQRLVSQGGRFALGFFQPDVTAPDRWYLAIWYNKISKHTPVWIANRGRPISDLNSSKLTISEDGNMVLLDRLESPIWATNITRNISNSTVGVILDTDNFVLAPASNTTYFLWQSFDEPTNVWLPGAKFGWNKVTGHTTRIISWESSIDPSPGYYTLEMDPDDSNQYIQRWNNSEVYWATGKWTGTMFIGVPEMASYPKAEVTYEFVVNDQESYFMYHTNVTTTTAMFHMEVSGQVEAVTWIECARLGTILINAKSTVQRVLCLWFLCHMY
ncbi:G-type lectin S-receptor-like serine/threonine-protein kinase At2g19130 [Panicum virgatum]|uniref:G-type lectin S-receptor-like serine/threonine-protein kinase At2g19130 n=1 Tax=Panicum virgatum TaxID=38727 RepID=UPI0019D637B1|nr:G-type lectin S-receptor-like serine/threonine-protein kinase At2g19130 [Panicum virgatum]